MALYWLEPPFCKHNKNIVPTKPITKQCRVFKSTSGKKFTSDLKKAQVRLTLQLYTDTATEKTKTFLLLPLNRPTPFWLALLRHW